MLTYDKSRTNAISQSQIALIDKRVHENQGFLKHLKADQESQQHSSKPEQSSISPKEDVENWIVEKCLSQLSDPQMLKAPEDVCDVLIFPEMDLRREDVTKAYKGTF